MVLAGLQKLSLIDYPKHLSCIVFTQGCNWRCSFCHNPDLLPVTNPKNNTFGLSKEIFFQFLETRIGKLDAVTITGGEPTLHLDLLEFITQIKALGFKVKLDSNGTNPDKLSAILSSGQVDYVAMDIKNTPEKYNILVNRKVDISRIQESVRLIMSSGLDYEFRTTCIPKVHTIEDFDVVAQWIKGAKNYYLQEYQTKVNLDPNFKYEISGFYLDLDLIKARIDPFFGQVTIRK